MITIAGHGPLPVAGIVTSASSGTPSKVATLWASVSVGQKRTPSTALHACPKGMGSFFAAATAGVRNNDTATAAAPTDLLPHQPALTSSSRNSARPPRAPDPVSAPPAEELKNQNLHALLTFRQCA